MKKYFLISMLCMFVSSNHADAKVEIQILKNEPACLQKKMSMDISIIVSDETFAFDPSCAFSFDETFTTKNGLKCKIEAGMCSSFSPKNRFEVNCNDKSHAGTDIVCP